MASAADLPIADLEDAVAPAEKPAARELVRELRPPAIRINGADTEWFAGDLALVAELRPAVVVLPKATPEAVAALGDEGPPVIAIIETARGVRQAYETACAPRVHALQLGAVDLGAEVGLEPRPDGLELLHVRSKLVVDSAAAGIRGPFDAVYLSIRDEAGLEAECRLARSLGLRGKACIHPAQVPVVNRAFGPTEDQVVWARGVVETFDAEVAEGRGVFALGGTMVDLPVVERARRILADVERREAR